MESERFLGNSKTSWTEEAQAVIQDVKSHVKTIQLSDKLNQNNTNNSQIYFNITTLEGQNLTVKLNSQGFAIVSLGSHDDVIEIEDSAATEETEQNQPNYFETPYSLLDSISPAYRQSFTQDLFQKLNNLKK